MKPGEIITMTKKEFDEVVRNRAREYMLKKDSHEEETEGEGMTNQQTHYNQAAAFQPYVPSPREYLHNFLIQAQAAGCNVSSYIDAEINKLLKELER